MSDLRELYQEVIIDHNRHPRHFEVMEDHTHMAEGFNPLCGDQLKLYLYIKNNVVQKASFQGSGCAISIASASLLTETVIGKSVAEAEQLFNHFHDFMMSSNSITAAELGKLAVLSGVKEFPARVKCATLAWHTLHAAIKQYQQPVSTE